MENKEQTAEYFIENCNHFIVNPPNLVIDFGNAKLCFDKQQIKIDELLDVYIKLVNYLNTFDGVNL